MKKGLIIGASLLTAVILSTKIETYKLNPNVNQGNIQTTICKVGWTAMERPPVSYTNNLKKKQLEDGKFVSKKSGDYEEDHRVSLELGGHPADPSNLVPQSYKNIVGGINLGAREKDVVESYLHREVCAGRMTLKDAQKKIVGEWAKIYLTLKGYDISASETDD